MHTNTHTLFVNFRKPGARPQPAVCGHTPGLKMTDFLYLYLFSCMGYGKRVIFIFSMFDMFIGWKFVFFNKVGYKPRAVLRVKAKNKQK